jgi:hypothetical protein
LDTLIPSLTKTRKRHSERCVILPMMWGGVGGFADFLEAISDPEHEEYEHLTEWAKSQWWKPFDFEMATRRVKGRF